MSSAKRAAKSARETSPHPPPPPNSAAAFPPKWVSPAIDALLLGVYYGLVTALAAASILGAVSLSFFHV